MKNKEFYKDKIFDAICKYRNLAVEKETGELSDGFHLQCKNCAFSDIAEGETCLGAWKLWLEQEHVEPLLTSKEKRYLENVVRPFKDRVKYIYKKDVTERYTSIYIDVCLYDDLVYTESFSLPYFDGTKMYTGIRKNKYYTLEELGLFADEEEDNEE